MLAALLLVVACACGSVAAQPPASGTPSPLSGWVLVTERDQDVTVRAGQRIEVSLSQHSGMTMWGPIKTDDEAVLQPVPTGITAVRGVTIAGFTALKPGTANITSTAGPLCSPNQACPMYAVLFLVRVTVT